MKPEALIAAAFVAIGVASCIARYDAEASLERPLPMSPAQDARNKQIDEALRSSFPVEQHCAKRIEHGHTVICISAEQLKRMEDEQR